MKTVLVKSLGIGVAGLLGASAWVDSANAVNLNFSYVIPTGEIISGMMEGEIQADGDTVFISSVTMPFFNGLPAPAVPIVSSVTEAAGVGIAPATVTFSGLFMDIVACDIPTCHDDAIGFAFEAGTGLGIGFVADPPYGDFLEVGATPFDASGWSLSVKDVPEPTLLLGSVLVAAWVGVSKRKQAG